MSQQGPNAGKYRALAVTGILIFLAACGGVENGQGLATGSGIVSQGAVFISPDTSDFVYLESITEGGSSEKFLARMLLNKPSVMNTGIVLIHGRGGDPNRAVVRQLRHDLYYRGFSTISIQAPVPEGYVEGGETPPWSEYEDDVTGPNYVFPETYARVRAAINKLKTYGNNQFILIGFSMGSRMGAAYVARGQPFLKSSRVIGFVGIGMRSVGIDPLNMDFTLDEITAPVLDIFGDGDTDAVNTAAGRVAVYGGSPVNYSQVELDCAEDLTVQECHKLTGLKGSPTAPLESTVSDWINMVIGL